MLKVRYNQAKLGLKQSKNGKKMVDLLHEIQQSWTEKE